MPLQNRVDPYGNFVAVSARGTLMGNRGCLHDDQKQLRAGVRWRTKAWIVCVLTGDGPPRSLMRPGNYTELFFLDEATALAAGHRPCGQCRREAYQDYRQAFRQGNGPQGSVASAKAIDALLHGERCSKYRHQALPLELPDGAIVEWDSRPFLRFRERLWPWTYAGYGKPEAPPTHLLTVLTPACSVAALRAGYGCKVHESATEK